MTATASIGQERRSSILLHVRGLVKGSHTVELTDSRLGTSSPCEALIACLVKREVPQLDPAEVEDGSTEEKCHKDREYDYDVAEPEDVTADTKLF